MVSYRGLTTVSRKNLNKRLDSVVKPRHDIEAIFRAMNNAGEETPRHDDSGIVTWFDCRWQTELSKFGVC
ncbi:MAG: palindromic element RPE4 domain-containing protein, partial [Rickettsia endosymbiont of Oxypoda opaca]|nr:palindromic element RPE4 domain-containing protein [Rickettsia endosymbiont of Oxypoda opaca]